MSKYEVKGTHLFHVDKVEPIGEFLEGTVEEHDPEYYLLANPTCCFGTAALQFILDHLKEINGDE